MDWQAELINSLQARFGQPDKSPLYVKFAETVQQAVKSGAIPRDQLLPSERDFSQLLGISRITVRKAMAELEEKSVIVRTRGFGTYINDRLEYSLKEARGFSQQMILQGKNPDTLWIKKSIVACSPDVSTQLRLPANSEVFLLKRIRYLDDEPVSIEESYVPTALIGDINDISLSLYDYFKRQNIVLQRTHSWVTARMPDEEFRKHISLSDKVPVLIIKQVAFDDRDMPIEYSISYCRADLYVFVAEE